MSWSPQQEAAIKAVRKWIASGSKQVFRLFGYAGTGKTTLAIHLANEARGRVMFATYTGKAALVMARKGCHGAKTLHSLIYKVDRDGPNPTFKINRDSDLKYASLLVVDEASMVDDKLAEDLLSFGVPLLLLGDPFQLPPVKGEGALTGGTPDVMLTEVHRQAADNPIIRLSMEVRDGNGLRFGHYGDSQVLPRDSVSPEDLKALQVGADQVLCGLNRTRMRLNDRIRKAKGLRGEGEAWHPTTSDRLVCLKNDREFSLLNGGLWTVDTVQHDDNVFHLGLSSDDVLGRKALVMVREEFFLGTEANMPWYERKQSKEFTFGQALTCHKSQGSQWDSVLVFDESSSFGENASRWLYTALTRAAHDVTILK